MVRTNFIYCRFWKAACELLAYNKWSQLLPISESRNHILKIFSLLYKQMKWLFRNWIIQAMCFNWHTIHTHMDALINPEKTFLNIKIQNGPDSHSSSCNSRVAKLEHINLQHLKLVQTATVVKEKKLHHLIDGNWKSMGLNKPIDCWLQPIILFWSNISQPFLFSNAIKSIAFTDWILGQAILNLLVTKGLRKLVKSTSLR